MMLTFAIPMDLAASANSACEALGLGQCFTIELITADGAMYLGGHACGSDVPAILSNLHGAIERFPVLAAMEYSTNGFDSFLAENGLSVTSTERPPPPP